MLTVVGVRFRPASRIYYFDPGSISDLQPGDLVVVNTTRGMEVGQVVTLPKEMDLRDLSYRLRQITRRATPYDRLQMEYFKAQEPLALQKCRELAAQRKLALKIIKAEYSFDGRRLTFYYESQKKGGLNKLVNELTEMFDAKIETRAIGARDCARYMGGIGYCGCPLCCATWLTDFAPVSIKKAKIQNLSLSPMDIAGVCGRLLCCLNYEGEFYEEVTARMPRVGTRLRTPQGMGEVVAQDILRETVRVRLDDSSVVDIPLDQLNRAVKEPAQAKLVQTPKSADRRAKPPSARRAKPRRRRRRRKKKTTRTSSEATSKTSRPS